VTRPTRERKYDGTEIQIQGREGNPAGDERHYAERDGAWVLEAEGVVEKAKADELRNHNIELRKRIEEDQKRFEGIDPDEFRRLVEEKRNLELQAQGHKPEEIEKIVVDRVKGLKADWDKQLAAMTGERDSLTTRLTAIQIDQGVITAATKRGLRRRRFPTSRRGRAACSSW